MPISFSAQLARIREEIEHLLSSPMIDAAYQDGKEIDFSFEVWVRYPAPVGAVSESTEHIEYRKELTNGEAAE